MAFHAERIARAAGSGGHARRPSATSPAFSFNSPCGDMFRLLTKSPTMQIQPSDIWVGMAWGWALTSPYLA